MKVGPPSGEIVVIEIPKITQLDKKPFGRKLLQALPVRMQNALMDHHDMIAIVGPVASQSRRVISTSHNRFLVHRF
jgi:hypothetical protein